MSYVDVIQICSFSSFSLKETTGCNDGSDGECCEYGDNLGLCGIGEGDCENDSHCFGSLKCGSNNCDTSLGFGPAWDCCYDDGYTPEGKANQSFEQQKIQYHTIYFNLVISLFQRVHKIMFKRFFFLQLG